MIYKEHTSVIYSPFISRKGLLLAKKKRQITFITFNSALFYSRGTRGLTVPNLKNVSKVHRAGTFFGGFHQGFQSGSHYCRRRSVGSDVHETQLHICSFCTCCTTKNFTSSAAFTKTLRLVSMWKILQGVGRYTIVWWDLHFCLWLDALSTKK